MKNNKSYPKITVMKKISLITCAVLVVFLAKGQSVLDSAKKSAAVKH